MISKKFRATIKLSKIPAWRIALKAGVDPSVLSKIMIGAIPVRPGDRRVRRVADVIGLREDECFENDEEGGGDNGN